VELQAAVLKLQTEIGKQRPDFPFRVGDQVLVDYAMNSARQDGIEMRHEFDVVAIIASNVSEVMREWHAHRKVVLKAGEPAVERMPPDINYFRIGKHPQNEADVIEVQRELISEEWAIRLAAGLGQREILFSDCAQSGRAKRVKTLRVWLMPISKA